VAEIRRTPAAGSAGRGRGMACRSPGLGFQAGKAPDHSWRGGSAATQSASRWSTRSGKGVMRSGLRACWVCQVGARHGTGVVGQASERTPGAVPRRQPWRASGRARRRAQRACARKSASALNRGATSCYGAREWAAPWYGGLGTARTERQRADRRSDAGCTRTARSPWRLGARGVGKARGGLGRRAWCADAEGGYGLARARRQARGGAAPALTARRVLP
jgi:hypothetical protein